MTRRRLVKALVGLPFVGGLFRQHLDAVDTPMTLNAWDGYVYLKSEGLSEFQASAVLAPYLQNNISVDNAAAQMLISQATSYGFLPTDKGEIHQCNTY